MTSSRSAFQYSLLLRCGLLALTFSVLSCEQLVAAPPGPTYQRDLLSTQEWKRLDDAVDRALGYLAAKQNRKNGSFAAPDLGQPGITSLCILAFLSRGHLPTEGPHHEAMHDAIEFVLSTQRSNGLLFSLPVADTWQYGTPTHTAIYNHAIAGLMLSEVYGMTELEQSDRIGTAITKAVQLTRQHQQRPKRNPQDEGGWRYIASNQSFRNDADLSVTSWQLMFLRAARNNGFEIPAEPIDDALQYIHRLFDERKGAFKYSNLPPSNHATRAVVGSGILSLSLGGEHHAEIATTAGDWVLKHPFDRYNGVEHSEERYHYSVYYCSLGMFQLGGTHWERFYPNLMRVLLANQQADGSWPAESNRDGHFGNAYTTALVVLALTPPYQLLPIYQR